MFSDLTGWRFIVRLVVARIGFTQLIKKILQRVLSVTGNDKHYNIDTFEWLHHNGLPLHAEHIINPSTQSAAVIDIVSILKLYKLHKVMN